MVCTVVADLAMHGFAAEGLVTPQGRWNHGYLLLLAVFKQGLGCLQTLMLRMLSYARLVSLSKAVAVLKACGSASASETVRRADSAVIDDGVAPVYGTLPRLLLLATLIKKKTLW